MRVLFTICPDESTLQYLVPLAQALRAAGHQVQVASQPAFAGAITETGLTAVPVGRDHDVWRAFGVKSAERTALRTAMLEPYDVIDQQPRFITWEYLRSGYDYHVTWWHKMDNLPMISGLVRYAEQWRPDLIIWEPTSYAGSIAAKAIGTAHARLLWSIDIYGRTREHYRRLKQLQPPGDRGDPLAEWLAGYATKYGTDFSEDMITGQYTITQQPESLSIRTDLDYIPMRYTPPSVARPQAPHAGLRIALAMDIEATEQLGGYRVSRQDIHSVLADLGAEVVGAQDMAGCQVVIHDGSVAAQLAATLYGVPQLVLPLYFDQPPVAQRIVEYGAGLQMHPHTVTGQAIRDNVVRLMREPSFRDNAMKLGGETLNMPSPGEVVPRLEAIAAGHDRED